MKKRGVYRLQRFFLAVLIFSLFIFFVMNSSALERSYFTDEPITLYFNEDTVTLKLISPSSLSLSYDITNGSFVFVPREVGNYSVLVQSTEGVQNYVFFVREKEASDSLDLLKSVETIQDQKISPSLETVLLENASYLFVDSPVKHVLKTSEKSISITHHAFNISVRSNDLPVFFEQKETFLRSLFHIFSSNEEISLILDEAPGEVDVIYFTPGPKQEEYSVSSLHKLVTVSSLPGLHYEHVFANTSIDEVVSIHQKDAITVYHREEQKNLDFEVYDTDNNGLIDHVSWVVDHLSEQTFEISLLQGDVLFDYDLSDFSRLEDITFFEDDVIRFSLRNFGSYELEIETPSDTYSRVGHNDYFFYVFEEEGPYTFYVTKGGRREVFRIDVVSREGIRQQKAVINAPVLWEGVINESSFVLPLQSENIVLVDKATGEIIIPSVFSNGTHVIGSIDTSPRDFIIRYMTPSPRVIETALAPDKKEVVISSDENLHYTQIVSYATLPFEVSHPDLVRVYWREEGYFLNFEVTDSDGNGLYDSVTWVVPHLSNQTFEIIVIVAAEHLDENKSFIKDIYANVSEQDGVYQFIPDGDFVRVTFEKELDFTKDITLYAKSATLQPSTVEVYEKDSSVLLATFEDIFDEGFYKIFLTNLVGFQKTFDLLIIGDILIDLIIDPTAFGTCQAIIACTQTGSTPTCTCPEVATSDNSYANGGLGTKSGTPAHISIDLTNSSLIPSGATITDARLYIEYAVQSGMTFCDIEYSSNGGSSWSTLDSDCTDQTTESLVWFDFSSLSESQLENVYVNITAVKNPSSGAPLDLDVDYVYLNVTYAVAGAISVALTYPIEIFYSNSFFNVFNYTPLSSTGDYLNCTFWDNSTSAWALNQTNTTVIVNGTNNSFSQTLDSDGSYVWNVECCDASNGCAFDFINRSIIVDTVNPFVTLLDPVDSYNTSSLFGVDFIYNVSDSSPIANCSLVIDGEVVLTDASITKNTNQTLSYPVSSGVHNWTIQCFDEATNSYSPTNRTINVTFTPQTYDRRWYETSTTNYTSTANISLYNTRDGVENEISTSISPSSLYTLVDAVSPFMVNNGALIGSGTVSFSGVVSASSNNRGYITWKVYVTNTTGDTLLCQHGDDNTGGTRISSGTGTWLGSCTLSSDVYLSDTDRIKLVMNIWNSHTASVTFTHYWDALRLSFVEFNSFKSLGDVSAELTAPLSPQVLTTGQELNVSCFVNCTAGECINSNVYLQQNTSVNGWTTINASSGNLLLVGPSNPQNYGNVTTGGNSTNFTVQGNVASVNNLRCIAISDYSSSNGTVTTQVTVVSANQAPQIDLVYPQNDSWLNSVDVTFLYNVSDDGGLTSCDLYVDGVLNQSNQTVIVNGSTNNFTVNGFNDGLHNWSVNCSDNTAQTNASVTQIFYIDTVFPIFDLLYPSDGATLSSSSSDFNFTVTDNLDDPLVCNITIDSVVEDLNFNANNGSVTSRQIGSLGVGTHYWNVSCIDEAGNLNISETRNFTVQDVAPSVVLVSPDNNTWINTTTVTFYYNTSDNNGLNSCDLYVDGTLNQSNQTIISNGSTNNFTVNGFNDGLHNWSVNCTDTGNISNMTETRVFYIDTVAPLVNLNLPANLTNSLSGTLDFNYTAIDALDSSLICNVTIGDVQYVTGASATNGTLTNHLISDVADGTHYWNVSCIDEAGNINTSQSYIINITEYPLIELNTADFYSFDSTTVVLNYTPSDNVDLEVCSLYLNGVLNQSNQTVVSNGGINNFTVSGVNPGYYNWSVYCTDTFGLQNNSVNRTFSVDTDFPIITPFYPANGSTIYSSDVVFNFTVLDDIDTTLFCNLTVNGVVFNSTNATNGSVSEISGTFATGGDKFWNITCIDDAGHLNTSLTRNFTLFTPPVVTLTYPNDTWINTPSFTFLYNVSDGNDDLKNSSLYINDVFNQSNQTAIVNDGENNFSIFGLADGFYNWTALVYDWENLSAQPTALPFYVDTVAPFVNLTEPVFGEIVTTNNVTINFSIIDSLSSNFTCNVTVDDFPEFEEQTYYNGSNIEYLLRNDGNYSMYVSCYDLATNNNVSETVNFSVIAPPNVTLNYPDAGFRTAANSFVANYTPEDAVGITQCILILDGAVNQTDIDIELNEPNFFTVENYTEGVHNWTVNCTDADGNNYGPSPRNFIRDNSPPLISLGLPQNLSSIDFNTNNILFRWTATDALDSVLTCNLTIDGTVTDSNLLVTSGVPRNENVPSSELGSGYHYWNVTCSDQVGNTNTSLMSEFNLTYPDFLMNDTLIFFNTTELSEDDTLLITAQVFNNEDADITDVTVNFYDGDPNNGGTLILSNTSVDILAFSFVNVTAVWVGDIGSHDIFVHVDPNITINGSFNETREFNNEGNRSITVGAWQTFYGFVSSSSEFSLADSSNATVTKWILDQFEYGNLYVADSEMSISWSSLEPLGYDTGGAPTADDFANLDTLLSMTAYNDSVYNTFTNSGTPLDSQTFTVFSSDILNVPIINSTNVTSFVTGILWDSFDDSDTEYDVTEAEDVVFVTRLNKSQVGAYGTYDYEIRVPAKLREYDVTDSNSAVFYVEIV